MQLCSVSSHFIPLSPKYFPKLPEREELNFTPIAKSGKIVVLSSQFWVSEPKTKDSELHYSRNYSDLIYYSQFIPGSERDKPGEVNSV